MKSKSIIAIALFILLLSPFTAFPLEWFPMDSGTTSNLKDIWAISGEDVFAVGVDGTILHYNGSAWSPMTSGTTQALGGVWGSSGMDVFAVGNSGVILHYDGTSWFAMSSGTITPLSDIWGSSGTDVFAVGLYATVIHYNGSNWFTILSSSGVPYFYSVWGSSNTDVFAVGTRGTIFHYNGRSWYSDPMPSGTTQFLYDIWGGSANDVFAVGGGGTILHYNGSAWSSMTSGTTKGLYGVWGSSGTDVFAVGDSGMILHYDGTSWSTMSSGTINSLSDIWGNSETDVFAVGTNGTILHYSDDADNDGILNENDNCPTVYNPDQKDTDNDEVGDVCDNCPTVANPNQADFDHNGIGDACDDSDSDGIIDAVDNCPSVSNPDQSDSDGDGFGNVCDQGDRFAVLDESVKKVFIFDLAGNLLSTTDLPPASMLGFIRDAGNSGWFVKGKDSGIWQIWHIDSSGALRKNISGPSIGAGPYYSGLNNGSFVTNKSDTGEITLYNSSGTVIGSTNAWTDPNGWSYSYVTMGDMAGLANGGFVVLPELGSTFLGGAGFTPYLYFYDNNLTLANKVNISSLHITMSTIVGLSGGGFAGLGNMDGGAYLSHLFYFDASGNLINQRDITGDGIPNLATRNFMNFTLSASSDGGVIVTAVAQSKVWVYHSPPVEVDLSGSGVTSIGGIGGSYFQSTVPTLITLSSFTITPSKRSVLFEWTTESEIDNAGFNLYRAEAENGEYVKINPSLIPAKGSATSGATYQFVNENVRNRITYYYKLEDIDLSGKGTMHGPVSAEPGRVRNVLKELP